MVDIVYKHGLPQFKKSLEKLREDFSIVYSKTDWTELRIQPLLNHLDSLEHLVESKEFSQESSRLRKGVVLFQSDMVYFRTNIIGLKKILEQEKKKKSATIMR